MSEQENADGEEPSKKKQKRTRRVFRFLTLVDGEPQERSVERDVVHEQAVLVAVTEEVLRADAEAQHGPVHHPLEIRDFTYEV